MSWGWGIFCAKLSISCSHFKFHAFNGKRLPQSRISQLIIYATISQQKVSVIFRVFLMKWFQPHEISNTFKHPPCPPTIQPLSALQLCLHEHRMLLRDLWDRLNVEKAVASLAQWLMVQWKITLNYSKCWCILQGKMDLLQGPLPTSMRQWLSFGLDHPAPISPS